MREAVAEAQIEISSYALSGEENWLAGYGRSQAAMSEGLRRLALLVEDNPQQTNKVHHLAESVAALRAALDVARQSYSPTAGGTPLQPLLATQRQAIEGVSENLQSISDFQDALLAQRKAKVDRSDQVLLWGLVGFMIAGCLTTLLGMLLFTMGIGNRIQQLEDDAHRLGAGLAPSSQIDAEDEIGRVARVLTQSSELIAHKNLELTEAKEEAERANRAKSEFLSRMSHELRTPLNSILGFGQVLQMGDLTERSAECVDLILKGGRHLLGLIDEILDISRIEAGTMALSPEPVLLSEAVPRAIEMIRPLAAASDIQIRYEPLLPCQQHVIADRQRLHQVLLNLLSNAVKYNRPNGTVRVAYERADDRIRIRVSDTGIGISPEDQGRLFVPFERLGAVHTEIQGTGLGLALCKRLVEAMQGSINIQSNPSAGTTFSIELLAAEAPVAKLEGQPDRRIAPSGGTAARCSLLYVEDNISNLRLMEHVLTYRPQVQLLSAMQGRLGLELAMQHRPDLIFLDLHLPDINGDVILAQLRTDPRTRDIPAIIISADATPRQVQRLMEMGATDYLTKPFDVQKMLRILDDCLKEKASNRASQPMHPESVVQYATETESRA